MSCCICYDEIQDKGTIDCGHSFCRKCIQKWSRRNTTCPLCRQQFFEIKTETKNIIVQVPQLHVNNDDITESEEYAIFRPTLEEYVNSDGFREALANDYNSTNPHHITLDLCRTIWMALNREPTITSLLDSGVSRLNILKARRAMGDLIRTQNNTNSV
jgi:hypothetical protein